MMVLENGRYINEYMPNIDVSNQKKLLERLEMMGFEKNGKYILTKKQFGVPITAMLFIMNDAMKSTFEKQDDLKKNYSQKKLKNEDVIGTYVEPKKLSEKVDEDFKAGEWTHVTGPNSNYPVTISGTSAYSVTQYLYPPDELNDDLKNTFRSIRPNFIIHHRMIEIKQENAQKKSMIDIFKNAIIFMEFSYAISQRIETEVTKFNDLFDQNIKIAIKGKIFSDNCMRRKPIIHNGILSISIDHKSNTIQISKNNLCHVMELGFQEAYNWINKVYGIMLSALK